MERLRVLIVDDEPGMRSGAERALRNFTVMLPELNGEISFDLAQAATGRQALQIIETSPPDIVLLDHKLPDISGLEILQRLADSKTDILVVMITAYASLEVAINATKLGAYDFLAKPFTPEELKASVRKAGKHILLQRQARRLADEKRRVRFEFISVLAHELKSPLAAIEGYLKIFQDRTAGASMEAYDPMVQRCLVRLEGMRKLIFDLLDLTRIESGQKKRRLVELDAREIARGCIEALSPLAAEKNLTVSLHADSPLHIWADRGEIEIILNNLLSNAIKYNRRDGRVDVRLEGSQDQASITVADTGMGMTLEETSQLFQEFTRIRNPRTKDIVGSGLGLSIVRKLALLYGGDVTVTSRVDEGSTFTVVLKKDSRPQNRRDAGPADAGKTKSP